MPAITLSVQLLILVAVGVLIGKTGVVKASAIEQFASLLMNVFMPCMVIKSMVTSFSMETLAKSGVLIVLACGMWVLTFAIGHGIYLATGRAVSGRLLRFLTIFPAYSFIGYPVVEALCGPQGLFYLVAFSVPYRILYFSTQEVLLKPEGDKRSRTWKERLEGWLSPAIIALLVSLVICLTGIKLPAPLSAAIYSMADCTSTMGVILCGLVLSGYRLRDLIKPRYMLYPLLRNLLMPVLFLGIAMLLGLEPELCRVVTYFAACPAMTTLAVLVVRFDSRESARFEAAAGVFLTTVFATFTIPLWATVLDLIFK